MGGKNTWFVPDGYLPGDSSHGVPSHEAACVLNTGIREARLAFTFYFVFVGGEARLMIALTLAFAIIATVVHVKVGRRDRIDTLIDRGP